MSYQIEYEKILAYERELRAAYVRIRTLLAAFDTKPGGTDRFEVTEKRLKELIQRNKDLEYALDQLIKLSHHYAELLNMHDGGLRDIPETKEAWLSRMKGQNDHMPPLSK